MKLNELKKNKKGFTLVEVIVVLVILAILMAIAIPSFMGYINKAKEREKDLTARNVFLAVSTVAAEYLQGNSPTDAELKTYLEEDPTALTEISNLAGITTIAKGDLTVELDSLGGKLMGVKSIIYDGQTYPSATANSSTNSTP